MWYAYSRRAKSLSAELDADLILIDTFITKNIKLRKFLIWIDYLIKSVVTFKILYDRNPDIIIATSPPSFCPMVCYFYGKLFKKKLVVDAHNSAFLKPWIYTPYYLKTLMSAKLVLVHNIELNEFLKEHYFNIKFFVLQDPLSNFRIKKTEVSPDFPPKYFLLILSFSADEPVELIFNAIRTFLRNNNNEKVLFYATGNYNKNLKIYNKYKGIKGIKFLGFVDDSRYEEILTNSFAIISFSTKKMVQQSAAIEALSAGIPLISEKSETNNRIFYKGAILTDIVEQEIYWALSDMIKRQEILKKEMLSLRNEYSLSWKESSVKFLNLLKEHN